MKSNTPVSSIMSNTFVRISGDISIGRAEKLMKKKGVDLIAVEKEGEFQGLITAQDFEYFKGSKINDGDKGPHQNLRLRHHLVSEIMHTRLVRLSPGDSISMAVEILRSILFQVIPIVQKNKLIGILTPEDISRSATRRSSFGASR